MIFIKLSFTFAFRPPHSNEFAIAIEFLYSCIVSSISNIHIIIRIHCDIMLMDKLSFTSAFRPPLHNKVAIIVKFLNYRISLIRDIYITSRIYSHPPWCFERFFGRALPTSNEFAIAIELLYIVISKISYKDITIRINNNTFWSFKLSFARTLSTQTSNEFAIAIELFYMVKASDWSCLSFFLTKRK